MKATWVQTNNTTPLLINKHYKRKWVSIEIPSCKGKCEQILITRSSYHVYWSIKTLILRHLCSDDCGLGKGKENVYICIKWDGLPPRLQRRFVEEDWSFSFLSFSAIIFPNNQEASSFPTRYFNSTVCRRPFLNYTEIKDQSLSSSRMRVRYHDTPLPSTVVGCLGSSKRAGC